MPEQRGKRRNRQRRRGTAGLQDAAASSPASPPAPVTSRARPVASPRRTGFQLPFWGNVAVATIILVVAVFLFAVPARGTSTNTRLLFFIAYLALSALYWGKAFRQYRARKNG